MSIALPSGRWVPTMVALCGLIISATTTSRADVLLYATSQISNQIVQVDVTTNQITPILSAAAPVDSLIFDASGNIIYSENTNNQVRIFNVTTHTDTLLATISSGPVDLALEPGGQSVLVSVFNSGRIDRINLTTHAVSTLGTYGGNPEGLAYDNQGRLFANLGTRDSGADKFVAQINPVTGAVIATSAHYSGLDGLTYDSFSGQLYSASLNSSNIVKVDPNNLSSSILPNSGVPNPDGIEADGKGNLYIAARTGYHIFGYDLTSNALTQLTFVNGLDDIAPVSGLGSQIPEPSSMTLVACMAAMAGAGAVLRRRWAKR